MKIAGWQLVFRVIQFIITVGLFVLLVKTVTWSELWQLAGNIQWNFALLSFLAVLGSHIFNIIRWKCLVQDACVSFRELTRYYGAGLFSNNFLPTGIGGDAIRIVLLRSKLTLAKAAFSVTCDRVLGLLSLACPLILGVYLGAPPGIVSWNHGRILEKRFVLGLLLVIIFLVIGVILWQFLPALRDRVTTLVQRYAPIKDDYLRWKTVSAMLVIGYLYSLVSIFLLVIAYWFAFKAITIYVPVNAAFWLVCVVSAAVLVPVTINGLGLQEGIFVLILQYYGIDADSALGVALFIRFLTLIFSIIGGLFAIGVSNTGGGVSKLLE